MHRTFLDNIFKKFNSCLWGGGIGELHIWHQKETFLSLYNHLYHLDFYHWHILLFGWIRRYFKAPGSRSSQRSSARNCTSQDPGIPVTMDLLHKLQAILLQVIKYLINYKRWMESESILYSCSISFIQRVNSRITGLIS